MITVGNGEKMWVKDKRKELNWSMQEFKFQQDLHVLKLSGSHMILGVDWLRRYNPLAFDFKNLKVTFEKDGEQVENFAG